MPLTRPLPRPRRSTCRAVYVGHWRRWLSAHLQCPRKRAQDRRLRRPHPARGHPESVRQRRQTGVWSPHAVSTEVLAAAGWPRWSATARWTPPASSLRPLSTPSRATPSRSRTPFFTLVRESAPLQDGCRHLSARRRGPRAWGKWWCKRPSPKPSAKLLPRAQMSFTRARLPTAWSAIWRRPAA